jgi:type IX secretion system substrate protein
MKKFLFLIIALCAIVTTIHAQEKKVQVKMKVITAESSDNSGVTVKFERTVPDKMEYSFTTDALGEIKEEIIEGIYTITIRKSDYDSHIIGDVELYSDSDLGDVELFYIGDYLTGEISGLLPKGEYKVWDTLFVPYDAVFTIAAGTILKFSSNAILEIEGIIEVNGNEKERVLFTSLSDEYWGGVKFGPQNGLQDPNKNSFLNYLTFEKSDRLGLHIGYRHYCEIENLIFENNASNVTFYHTREVIKMSNSIIRNNSGKKIGGLNIHFSSAIISNCLITGNENTEQNQYQNILVGGVRLCVVGDGKIEFSNCIVTKNKSVGIGGMIIEGSKSPSEKKNVNVINTVVADNYSEKNVAGIYLIPEICEINLSNCIVANNRTKYTQIKDEYGNVIDEIPSKYGYQLVVPSKLKDKNFSMQSCLIFDKVDNMLWDNPPKYFGRMNYLRTNFNNDSTDAYGNIFFDPMFVDPENGDYSLQPNSKAIDAGFNSEFLSELDFDGNARLWDGNGDGIAIVDIGAYEFGAPIGGTIKQVFDNDFESTTHGLNIISYGENKATFEISDEDAFKGSKSLLLDNSKGKANDWVVSDAISNTKGNRYFSCWIKFSGDALEADDKIIIASCNAENDITEQAAQMMVFTNLEREWQKVLVEIPNEVNDNFKFALAAQITHSTKIFVDDMKLEAESGTSVDDEIEAKVSVYPNPSADKISFTGLDNKIQSIEIYDISGKLLKVFKNDQNDYFIGDLGTGAYTVRIKTMNSLQFAKFIVK